MNYWLISDTHFNHEGIEKWGGRSGNWQSDIWEGMRSILEGDTLIHLGDVCIGEDVFVHDVIKSLKCKKVLVRGNHDGKSHQWYTDHGWDFVCDGLEMRYMGHYLHLTHRPARPQGNTTWNIHGHTHGNMHRSEEYLDFYSEEYHIDISPELVGYKPLRLDTILKKLKQPHGKVETKQV
jgi:calcineurin-like phosphoesterase family protein